MKRKKYILCLSSILVIILAIVITIICCWPQKEQETVSPLKSYVQSINTEESLERINNADQGFYHPIYVTANEKGINYAKWIVTESTQLYHLRIEISAFSKAVNGESDKLLTNETLSGIEELLSYLKQQGKSAIIRFAYDPGFSGKANKEAGLEMILKHIQQVCPILNKFETTITGVEVGLIGPWGEMHTSAIANKENINPIIDMFLNSTNNLPILTRTPNMIYNYLGITINDIENYTIAKTSKAYRLGIYNDGYLGSSSDLGTYTNREKEIEFLSQQTNHLPFGGEVVVPDSSLHNIENCLPEMAQIHLNYLNVEWNNLVIDKWKNSIYNQNCGKDENYYGQSAFTYIENHMGYRFILTKSVFEFSDRFDKLNIKLSFNNVGFGNLNKSKFAKILFVDENGEIKYSKQIQKFDGGENFNCSLDIDFENGEYQVYLALYGEEVDGILNYNLQLANCDIWNNSLKANKIGEINIKKL
jgi:hypothetical protein